MFWKSQRGACAQGRRGDSASPLGGREGEGRERGPHHGPRRGQEITVHRIVCLVQSRGAGGGTGREALSRKPTMPGQARKIDASGGAGLPEEGRGPSRLGMRASRVWNTCLQNSAGAAPGREAGAGAGNTGCSGDLGALCWCRCCPVSLWKDC